MSLLEAAPIRNTGEIPRGTHNPTILIPGFTEPDALLKFAEYALNRKGRITTTSHIGVNTGRVDHDIGAAEKHLVKFHDKHHEPVTLVGHSLGGLYGRVLARRHPEKVKAVITVGSPSHLNPIESIRSFQLAGKHFIRFIALFLEEFTDEVREPIDAVEHHIHSSVDPIVNHLDHCDDPPATHHHVLTLNHAMMMTHPIILKRLHGLLPK